MPELIEQRNEQPRWDELKCDWKRCEPSGLQLLTCVPAAVNVSSTPRHFSHAAMSLTDRSARRGSLQGSLPPLGSLSSSAAGTASHAGISSSATAASAAAAAYKSYPSDLSNSLSKATPVDRASMAEQRRKALRSSLASTTGSAILVNSASAGGSSSDGAVSSGGDFKKFHTGMTSLSFGAKATYGGSSSVSTSGPMRIPTPLPHVHAAYANDDTAMGIHLNLPSDHHHHHRGGSIASAPNTMRAAAPAASSSLASLTQDSNARLSHFLEQYEGKRDTNVLDPNSSSVSLLLYGMVRLSSKELAEEKEVSRKLLGWHPARSAKVVGAIQNKIKSIISAADRDGASSGSGGGGPGGSGGRAGGGKPLGEDERVREDLPKRRSTLFRIAVPSNAAGMKIELEVIEGRVELYLSVGDTLVNQSNYAKEKFLGNCWMLRGGVGNHALQVSQSEPGFRTGENYSLTIFAVTQAVFAVRVLFGGKGGKAGILSISLLDASSPSSSSLEPLPPGPASSTSRPTYRQAHSSHSGPSVRNIRRALLEKIKNLQENPKALSEFQSRVSRVRRRGVEGHQGSRDVHAPAHLTDTQLRQLNQREGAAEAQREAEQHARAMQAAMSPSQRHNHRSVPSPGGRSPSPPTAAAALPRPVALTPHSLDVIPHIQAIQGVSQVFFDAARAVRTPYPLLDERDCIIVDSHAHAAASAAAAAASQQQQQQQQQVGAGQWPGQVTHNSSAGPSKPRTAEAKENLSVDVPSSPAPASTHQHHPPALERKLSLGSVMQAFLQRVFKALRIRAAKLTVLANPMRTASSQSARQMMHTPPPPQQLQQIQHSLSPEDVERARDEAHFIHRCLGIYAAHLSELESILLAHASGDRSLPHVARLLPPPQGGPRPSAEKNFLLTNAFNATENKIFEPRHAERRRKEWAEAHEARMLAAAADHERVLAEKREATLSNIERKEQQRAASLALKHAAEEQRQLEERQKKWLCHIAASLRHMWLLSACSNLDAIRAEIQRKAAAAIRLQRFIRRWMQRRRRARSQAHVQAFRSSVTQYNSANGDQARRDRAANVIVGFISAKKGVNSVTRLVRNFTRRVGICQRACRGWLAVRDAKIELWRLQYVKAVKQNGDPHVTALLSSESSRQARDGVLQEHFAAAKRQAVQMWSQHMQEMRAYDMQLANERAKASILTDHVIQVGTRPKRPRVPAVLSQAMLTEVLEQVMQRTRSIARQQLLNTADTSDDLLLPVMASAQRASSGQAAAHPSPPRHRKRGSTHTLGVDFGSGGGSSRGSANNSRPTSGQPKAKR